MQTRLTKLLGTKYPIIQGGMAWIADATLASAVSEAGGLGVISAMNADAEWVRSEILRCRTMTDKPFGVNIMLMSPHAAEVAKMVAEERVPVVTTGAGNPSKYIARWKEAGVKVLPVVASTALARLVERAGADAVIAEGGESGGAQDTVTEFILPKRYENTAAPNPDKPVGQTITPLPFPDAGKSTVPNTADYAPPTDIRAPHYSAQNEARQYVPPKSELGRGFEISFHDSVPSMSPTGSAESKPSFAGSTFTEANGKNADAEKEDVFAENKKYLELLAQKAKQQKIVFENAVYKGSLFNTYLIYEEGDNAYLIDQHAAHERLIFDRLCAEMKERKVIRQPMLVPFVLSVNREESQFVADNLDNISDIGFEIEEFGEGSYKISAVPVDLQDIDLQAFFAELLGELGNLRGIRLNELLRDKIAMTACKHAIKGGMALTDSEKEKLFAMLRGDMGLKCPHGRPVAVKLTKYEIEKMFKRIV